MPPKNLSIFRPTARFGSRASLSARSKWWDSNPPTPWLRSGNTCFQDTDPANSPSPATDVEVQQGKVEGSNVPVAEAAMRLVGVMRQFEMLQKAIGISREMDTKSIQEVRGSKVG